MKRLIIGALLLWALAPQAHADVQSAIASYRAGDFQAAFDELKMLAEQNDPLSQHALGLLYAEGAGVQRNRTEAARWYAKAAEQGLAQSQYNLAVSYFTGIGVPQDYGFAAKWYRKAALQGDARAQNNLGYMYDTGRGVEVDTEQAVYWYQPAATAGNVNAQINLANSYHRGRGVEKDKEKALEWYAKVFNDLHSQDPLSLWLVDRVGRTSSYSGIDGKTIAVPRLESKRFVKRPDIDPALRPLRNFNR